MKNGLDAKFEVTGKDIKYGLPGDSTMCAIARCAKRDGWDAVDVNGDQIEVSAYGVRWVADLPKKAKAFVKLFDEATDKDGGYIGKKVCKPFSFQVRLIPKEVVV